MKLTFTALLPMTLAAIGAMAHPDLHGDELVAYRRNYVQAQEQLGKRCSATMRKRRAVSNFKRSVRGHPPMVQRAMYEAFTRDTDSSDNTTNSACILAPEVTQGPYHILGEQVRTNVTEDQGGVPLTLTMSFTDVNTCEPLSDYWVDFWHANATGIYSGYIEASTSGGGGSSGGGDSNSTSSSNSTMSGSMTGSMGTPPSGSMTGSMPADSTGSSSQSASASSSSDSSSSSGGGSMSSGATDQNTFLRGVAQTDSEGQVTFDTVFPGWYVSRSVHIHIRAYEGSDGYQADNGTFVATGLAHHTGQLFFEDSIGESLSTISPYSENTLTWDQATKNDDDQIYVASEDGGWTAIVNIVYVDENDITKGMTGSIDVAVNTTFEAEELSNSYWTGTTTTGATTSLATALSTGDAAYGVSTSTASVSSAHSSGFKTKTSSKNAASSSSANKKNASTSSAKNHASTSSANKKNASTSSAKNHASSSSSAKKNAATSAKNQYATTSSSSKKHSSSGSCHA